MVLIRTHQSRWISIPHLLFTIIINTQIISEERLPVAATAQSVRRSIKNMSANAEDRINLKVKGQDGNIEVIFRIKRSTRLKKLMKAYCDRRSVEFNSIAFLFHGRRLQTDHTPHQLEMEDGDEIDAHVKKTVIGVGVVMEYVLLLFIGLLKFCEVGDVLCLVCVVIYGICVCVSHPPFRMVYETDP